MGCSLRDRRGVRAERPGHPSRGVSAFPEGPEGSGGVVRAIPGDDGPPSSANRADPSAEAEITLPGRGGGEHDLLGGAAADDALGHGLASLAPGGRSGHSERLPQGVMVMPVGPSKASDTPLEPGSTWRALAQMASLLLALGAMLGAWR